MVGPVDKSQANTPPAQAAPPPPTQTREKPAKEPPLLADGAKVEAKQGKVPAAGVFQRLGEQMDATVEAGNSHLDAAANAGKKVLQKIKEKPWILTPPGALYEIFKSQEDVGKQARDAVNNIINQLKDPKVLEKAGIGKPLTLGTLNPEADKKLQKAVDEAVKKLTAELRKKPTQVAAEAAKTAAEITLIAVAPFVGLPTVAAKKVAEVVAQQPKK